MYKIILFLSLSFFQSFMLTQSVAPEKHYLAVERLGSGTGEITSGDGQVQCRDEVCVNYYIEGTEVVLTASVDSGDTFIGWAGENCSGTSSCTVTMDKDRTVRALFFDPNSLGSLEGDVDYQFDIPQVTNWDYPLELTFNLVGTDAIYTVLKNINSMGYMYISNLAVGNYIVSIKNAHSLQSVHSITISEGSNSYDFGELEEGDVNNDNAAGILDFSIMRPALGACEGDENYDERADLNEDDCVLVIDFSIFRSNFGKEGVEIDIVAPELTSSQSLIKQENAGVYITKLTATDDTLPVSFEITGGADANILSLSANYGDLIFNADPDYEYPSDSNGDNVYEVYVHLTDGMGNYQGYNLEVTVSNDPSDDGSDSRLSNITTNESDYSGGEIPQYEKFEIRFDLETVAENLQWPYEEDDPNCTWPASCDTGTPLGIEPGIGVSVDAVFTDPDGVEHRQPAFYYQEFGEDENDSDNYEGVTLKGEQEWYYPTGSAYWVARFSPDKTGSSSFRLEAVDSDGSTASSESNFTVTGSDNPGFVKVSEEDSRYFEFDNGDLFTPSGYHYTIDTLKPVSSSEEEFTEAANQGAQFGRIWLSGWSIWGSQWTPLRAFTGEKRGYLDDPWISFEAEAGRDTSVRVEADDNQCVFLGWNFQRSSIKRNTDYRVSVRYKVDGLSGPTQTSLPHGFVIKQNGWLWDDPNNTDPTLRCGYPGTGDVISGYGTNEGNWQTMEGTFNSGSEDYLPYTYFALENLSSGTAYIQEIQVQENMGNGNYGPNVAYKPGMDYHRYFDQRSSYEFDQVVKNAGINETYLKLVLSEKDTEVLNRIGYDGSEAEHNNENFYGDWNRMTKTRWLHKTWWRYAQARWGYSPNVHSWELINEGDPYHTKHYTLADELGQYMHCEAFGIDLPYGDGQDCTYNHPNDHLVTTSFWHSFPKDEFWSHWKYPNVDYADIHEYILENDQPDHYEDLALETYSLSTSLADVDKPIVRGETGLLQYFPDADPEPTHDVSIDLQQDTEGVWLRNMLWSSVNYGGMSDLYWYTDAHINRDGLDIGRYYKSLNHFMTALGLNQGGYIDAKAVSSNSYIRAWGQKQSSGAKAYLWIQNSNHTWRNIVDEVNIKPESGTVKILGMTPNMTYQVSYWDTSETDPAAQIYLTEQLSSNVAGEITISVSNLTSDFALTLE